MESGRATHGIYFDWFDVGGWRDGPLRRRLGKRRRSGPPERLCGASVEPCRPGGTRIPASASSAGRGTAPWRATGCSKGGAGSLGAAPEARAPGFRARYRPRLPAGPADGSGAAQSGGRRREATRMPLRHCQLRSRQAALGHRRGLCRLSSRRLDPNDAPYPRHGSGLGLCSPRSDRRRPHAAAAAHPATGSSALRTFGCVAQRDKASARRRLRQAQHLQSASQWAPDMCCPAPSPEAPAHRLEQPATAALAGRSTAFARAARASAFAASHGLCTATSNAELPESVATGTGHGLARWSDPKVASEVAAGSTAPCRRAAGSLQSRAQPARASARTCP